MRGDTWIVRSAGESWRLPGRGGYDPGLMLSYSLYLILLQLSDTSSIIDCGEFNTYPIGDTALCDEVLPVASGFDAVQFTAKSNNLHKTLTLSDATYTRMYGSMWVSIPAAVSGGEMSIGLHIEDSATNDVFDLFLADEFASNFYTEMLFNALSISNAEVVKYPTSDIVNERWVHILWEVDTTEATPANRAKVYHGDVKRTTFNEIDVPQNETFALGTGPHEIYLKGTDPAAFGVIDATAKIAAAWVKFATTDLFDFDNVTDRRKFISASLEYVTHASVMDGKTADFWGAGDLTGWSGWTNTGGTSVSEAGTLTSLG